MRSKSSRILIPSTNHIEALLLLGCILIAFITVVDGRCSGPRTPSELSLALWGPGSNYTKRTRPNVAMLAANSDLDPSTAQPENVLMSLHILSMKAVNQQSSEFELIGILRQRWNDYRLQFSTKSLGGCFSDDRRHEGFADITQIWHPDIAINNVVAKPNVFASAFYSYPSGDVLYEQSMKLRVSCRFDFIQFPRDSQECEIVVGTWLEDASETVLSFSNLEPSVTLADEEESEVYAGSTEWKIVAVGGEDDPNFARGAMTAESNVMFYMTLERNYDYYLDFVILPSAMFTTISWFSFFINRNAVPARIAMTMFCFLTNMNFLATQLRSLPRLGNEVWLLKFLTTSVYFTVYAVLEYVLCNYLLRCQRRIQQGKAAASRIAAQRLQQTKTTPTNYSDDTDENNSGSSHQQRKQEQPMAPPPPPDDVQPTKADYVESGFKCRVALILMKQNGTMIFADEHVDIFSRWIYPIAYAAVFATLWHI